MARYLLDTNHLGEAIRNVSLLRDRVRERHRQGNRFATCWPVLCEIEAGISQSKQVDERRRTLFQLLKNVAIWPIDWGVCRHYGKLFQILKNQGRVISHVDLVLAAFADQWHAVV